MKKIFSFSFRMIASAFMAVAISFVLCEEISRFFCSSILCSVLFAFWFGVFNDK